MPTVHQVNNVLIGILEKDLKKLDTILYQIDGCPVYDITFKMATIRHGIITAQLKQLRGEL